MSIIKAIPPGAQDFGVKTMQLIKVASNGLRGNDLNTLIKRAGHDIASDIKNLTFDKGEIPVHLIAVGATEFFGPNRNYDGFKEAACKGYHDTFVKYARFYRHHKNKDKSKSYGIVKMSSYNEDMHRIELVVALNGTKEAAVKNGGLVADEEIHDLEAGRDIGVSMSCKVAFDVCSGCGNRAKTRKDYCYGSDEGGSCKAGGLQNNIGAVLEDGQQLYAENPFPFFFDISKVKRPADRTAFVTGKVANDFTKIGGAELAELLNISAPLDLYSDLDYGSSTLAMIKLAREMAARESSLLPNDKDLAITTYTDFIDGNQMRNVDRSYLLKALVNEKIAMTFSDWLKLVTKESDEKIAEAVSAVTPCLPTVFSDLIEDPLLGDLLSNNSCRAGRTSSSMADQMAKRASHDCSLDSEMVKKRLWRAVLQGKDIPRYTKSASTTTEAARNLAKQYAVYQIGFLSDLANDKEIDLTKELVVRQNRIQ